jgi:hypothetical protein
MLKFTNFGPRSRGRTGPPRSARIAGSNEMVATVESLPACAVEILRALLASWNLQTSAAHKFTCFGARSRGRTGPPGSVRSAGSIEIVAT